MIAVVIMTAAITSCGTDRHHFSLEGRFLNMNQGSFYVYGLDGVISNMDTINVVGGRFAYTTPCEREGIIVIVLPNFSEIPVFIKPGESVDMKADASHIKDIEVSGTKDNELMTKFRKSIDGMSPPDQKRQAEQFVKDNPQSLVSLWLIRKYFVVNETPDLKKAKKLIEAVEKDEKHPAAAVAMSGRLKEKVVLGNGDRLPAFTAVDINGRKVSSESLMKGDAIIVAWATWNHDGMNMQRQMRGAFQRMKHENRRVPEVLSICLDASPKITKQTLKYDSLGWPVVCDGQMWDSPLVKKLGISTIPDNIILKNGKIVGRHRNVNDVISEMEKKSN